MLGRSVKEFAIEIGVVAAAALAVSYAAGWLTWPRSKTARVSTQHRVRFSTLLSVEKQGNKSEANAAQQSEDATAQQREDAANRTQQTVGGSSNISTTSTNEKVVSFEDTVKNVDDPALKMVLEVRGYRQQDMRMKECNILEGVAASQLDLDLKQLSTVRVDEETGGALVIVMRVNTNSMEDCLKLLNKLQEKIDNLDGDEVAYDYWSSDCIMNGMVALDSVHVRSLAADTQTAAKIAEVENAELSLAQAGKAIDAGDTSQAAQLLSQAIGHYQKADEPDKAAQIGSFLAQVQAQQGDQ
jgi:hypothetical protein